MTIRAHILFFLVYHHQLLCTLPPAPPFAFEPQPPPLGRTETHRTDCIGPHMLRFPISIGDYFPVGPVLPRELLHFELSPETLARDSFLLNVASVSALTWVVYDMVLNFNREVNLVWKRWREPRGRHSRRLYVIVRYFSVCALAWFVGVNTSVGLSLDFCRVWYYIVLVNTTIITLLPDIMLLIRVNAVYSWNLRTLLFTIFLFMIQMTTSLVAGVLAVTSAQLPSQNPFPVSGCPVALSTSVARFTLVAWIPSILAQATYFGLMLYTLAHLIRSLDVGASPPPPSADKGTPCSSPIPVPTATYSPTRSHVPSSPVSYTPPSPSRSTRSRLVTSTPSRQSSLPVLRVPQPSPLASTSTLSSPAPAPTDSQESAATLVSPPAFPFRADPDHESDIDSHVRHIPDMSNASSSAGSRSGGVKAFGGAEEPRVSSNSNVKVSSSSQDNLRLAVQRSRTISIQARDIDVPQRVYHQAEDRKSLRESPVSHDGSLWRYTPSLFSLFSWKGLKQVQKLVPTMMVFVEHGGWYFILAILAKVANAIMVTTFRGPLQAFAIPLMMALYPVLVSRIYLSMVHYLHFGLAKKNRRILGSYDGENYASGYRGDTSTYGTDDDEDTEEEDLPDEDYDDRTRSRRDDPERFWEAEQEERFTLGKLKFSLGGSRKGRKGADNSSSNGKGRGQGRPGGTGGRRSHEPEPGRRHKPRGPRLGRITFAARESLANSSVLDLGFGNEEF